jgi:hypothetical protein
MGEAKRDRRRLKRARKRKRRAFTKTQASRTLGRELRGMQAADEAADDLQRGALAEAVRHAARAAALNPRDHATGLLYLAAAERSGDLLEQRKALEHLVRLTEPDPLLLIRLAYLHLETGEPRRAGALAREARQTLPRRMRDRRRWLTLLEHVEERVAFEERPATSGQKGVSGWTPVRDEPGNEPGGTAKDPGHPILPLFAGLQAPMRASPDATRGPGGPAGDTAPDTRFEPPPRFLEIPVEVAPDVDGVAALAHGSFATLEDVGLASLAAQIRDAESYDRLVAVERAEGLMRLSHQEETARKVLSVLLGRALLADEVGLGKTIEAGLVLSECLLRGRVESALILVPPSLVGQWREELLSKFRIEARTTDDGAASSDAAAFWSSPGIVVASLATARTPRHRDLVTSRSWDMVIVDEAHALKNSRTESYALVSRLTSRFLLLLTATPVENRIEELYNLVSLLRPGHLGGRSAFLRRFADRHGRVSETARRDVRALLGEVMVRNTRALSGVRLPPRFARTLLVEPQPAERELYEHLVVALRALGASGRTRLLLSVLLQEAGSSPYAVRATLEKIRSSPERGAPAVAALSPAIECATRPVQTGKGATLLRALDGAGETTIVFTRFRATLDFLASLLAGHRIDYERVHGDVPAAVRQRAIERCRHGGVLLSTDVGSEGLNLQFCRRVINFDLPWNPMRIEQRIGRVHRIGQEHPVDVINLCLAGSIEERILSILDERINLFELVVGEVDMILGYLEEDRDFPDIVLDAFAEPEETRRERAFGSIADALTAARLRYARVKAFDEHLFRNELGV